MLLLKVVVLAFPSCSVVKLFNPIYGLFLCVYSQRVDDVVWVGTTEVVPTLVVAAAEQTVVESTATVVDVRKVIVNGANVRERNVPFDRTLAC